jgi:hypothetical protein
LLHTNPPPLPFHGRYLKSIDTGFHNSTSMWCNRLVNRCSPSLRAASRTLNSPVDAPFSPCVPCAAACSRFPSATVLLSTDSAGGWPSRYGCAPLFIRFLDTIPVSDFPVAFTLGLWPRAFSNRTGCGIHPVASGISRFPGRKLVYVPWFFDSAGPIHHSRYRGASYGLPHHRTGSATRT